MTLERASRARQEASYRSTQWGSARRHTENVSSSADDGIVAMPCPPTLPLRLPRSRPESSDVVKRIAPNVLAAVDLNTCRRSLPPAVPPKS